MLVGTTGRPALAAVHVRVPLVCLTRRKNGTVLVGERLQLAHEVVVERVQEVHVRLENADVRPHLQFEVCVLGGVCSSWGFNFKRAASSVHLYLPHTRHSQPLLASPSQNLQPTEPGLCTCMRCSNVAKFAASASDLLHVEW